MPFTGLFTLHAQADPAKLGQHHYESWWKRDFGAIEVDRGIIYTCRAGFIDLSHVREYMDWARYIHDRSLERLLADPGTPPAPAEFEWSDSSFSLRVQPLPLTLGDRRGLAARRAAVTIAERGTVIMGTWHEIATWHGQKTVPGISEKRSAFTWDDTTSHVVAAHVAARALHSGERDWNIAATRALNEELDAIGATPPSCETEAVERTEGLWWAEGSPIRRDLDTGLETGEKTPWLAPDLSCCRQSIPLRMSVATWHDREPLGQVEFTITPPRWLAKRAWGLDNPPTAIRPDEDFPAIMARLRGLVLAEHGPLGDSPERSPATPTASDIDRPLSR